MIKMDGLYRACGGKSTVLADDRPVAKKVAWAVAQGSELGFTATKAARRREVGRRKGQGQRRWRADKPGVPGYVGGPALDAGRSCVTLGVMGRRIRRRARGSAGRSCVTPGP